MTRNSSHSGIWRVSVLAVAMAFGLAACNQNAAQQAGQKKEAAIWIEKVKHKFDTNREREGERTRKK